MLALFDVVQAEANRPADDGRVLFNRSAGPQIQNHHILACLLLAVQFIHRDARHPQLSQQPLPLPQLEAYVQTGQSGKQSQGTAANTCERLADLLNLAAEEIAQEDETTAVKQRTDRVHKKKSAGTESGHPRQRRGHCAQARHEFSHQHASQPVPREYVLGATNA